MDVGKGQPQTQTTTESETQKFSQVRVLKVTTQQLPPASTISDDTQWTTKTESEGKVYSSMETNYHSDNLFSDSDATPDDLDSSQGTMSPIISPSRSGRSLLLDSDSQASSSNSTDSIQII